MAENYFEFDPETHVYKLGGVRIPSVTQILKDLCLVPDFPAGPYRMRGRAVHTICELWDRGVALDESQCGETTLGFLSAWKSVSREYGWTWDAIEERLFDPLLLVAGTLDRRGHWNGKRLILDIKSGGGGREVELQTAAYAQMAYPETACQALRCKVEIHQDGTYNAPVFYDNWQDFTAWQGAVRLWQWKQRKGT